MRSLSAILASLSILSLVACTPGNRANTKAIVVSWGITNAETDGFGKTNADVALLVKNDDGSVRDHVLLGTFDGCGVQETPTDGPILTLSCWWAGAGDDFQVRFEGTNTLVVDHRIVDEMADIPDFAPMTSVTVPEGVKISGMAQ